MRCVQVDLERLDMTQDAMALMTVAQRIVEFSDGQYEEEVTIEYWQGFMADLVIGIEDSYVVLLDKLGAHIGIVANQTILESVW